MDNENVVNNFGEGVESNQEINNPSKSWYRPNPGFSEEMFSEIEKLNKITIVEYEKSRGWR